MDSDGSKISEADQEAFDSIRPYAPDDIAAWRIVRLYKAALKEAWEKMLWETGSFSAEGISLINKPTGE